MQRLNKSQFMKKVINDYYDKKLKKSSGERDAMGLTITGIDNSIRNGSRGKKRLTSW